jgi:pimeloyl-ACP methyl ester carboxylesterase
MDTQLFSGSDLPNTSKIQQGRRLRTWFSCSLLILLDLAFVLPVTGLVYQSIVTRIEERRFLPPGQLTNVGGYMLHIHCMGEGSPTVIMEGGLGGTSLDWSLVQPEVAKITRVCSYDRAGLGWSEPNPSNAPHTSEQITEELHTLLTNTGITGPYLLAGLSAGGMHVQMFANRYPDEVLGMVLVDPTPAKLMASFSADERKVLVPNLDQFGIIQKLEPFGLLRFLPIPGSEALEKLPSEIQDRVRAVNLRTGAADALYQDAAGFEPSILQTAALAPMPSKLPVTVIWHGIPAEPLELDPIAESSLRKIAEQSEYGNFVIAENSGHYITFDRPDVVIEELNALLKIARFMGHSDLLQVAMTK